MIGTLTLNAFFIIFRYLEDHDEWFGDEFYLEKESLALTDVEDLEIGTFDIKEEIEMEEID